MRKQNSPLNPKTLEEFVDLVKNIENSHQSYNTITDALADTTAAYFNYFASKHGMTGYQASYAGLEFLKKTRGMEMPFMIVDSSKMLYPQYDLVSDVEEFLEESKTELAKVAKKNLEELDGNSLVSLKVVDRWKELASMQGE